MQGVNLEFEKDLAQWHVLKGDTRYGPFSYLEVVGMLQEKDIFEFNYIWRNGMENWERIALVDEFSSENISRLRGEDMPDDIEIFYRRRYPRTSFEDRVLVHNNKTVWNGRGVEIGPGGAGLVINTSVIQPLDILQVHFIFASGLLPFNASCEVVSKEYVTGTGGEDCPIRYGLRFIQLDASLRNKIREFASKGISKAS